MGSLAATSNKVTLRSVDIDVQFNIISTATGVASSVQYEICEIGKFTYDFAVTTDVDDIDKVGIRAGAITISFFDNTDADHYQSIYDAYFDGTSTLITGCQINIYNPSGAGSADVIKCRFSNQDITYDINQRKTTINFQPLRPSDSSTTMSSVFDGLISNIIRFDSTGDEAVKVHSFIDYMLTDIYGSGTNSIITNFPSNLIPINDRAFYVFENVQDGGATMTAAEVLANIAGAEGSVYGNMLGKKVYFARNLAVQPDDATVDERITLTENQFKSLKLDNPKKNQYRELKVIHGNLSSSSTSSLLDSNADKTANFSFRRGHLDRRLRTGSLTISTSVDFNNEVAAFGVASYEKLFLDTQAPSISGTVFGVNSILPHQVLKIEFASSTTGGSRLITPLNATYRFSKVTYDLVNDTVDFNAYKIA